MFSRLNVICGHYGSGKTNLALNMALKLAESGKAVTIVDMDIVNPYFRTTDYVEILKEKGRRQGRRQGDGSLVSLLLTHSK